MPADKQNGLEDRTGARASGESEITDLYRGFSKEKPKEGKPIPNHATLSVWAAALILCSVLVFSAHQLRGKLQGIQDTLAQVGQENKLLLEGLDELLVRADRSRPGGETASLAPESPIEAEATGEQEGGPDNLARKYKIYYRAKDGEDLTGISEKFSVSEDQLRLWNALKPDDSIMPGQVLVINKSTQEDKPVDVAKAPAPPDEPAQKKQPEPAKEETPAQGPVSKAPPQSEEQQDEPVVDKTVAADPTPMVESGKTLAAAEDTRAPEVPEAMADEPADKTVHVVQRGESLTQIGQDYGISWLDLAKHNDVEPPGTIYVGQKLRIPEFSDVEEEALPVAEVKHRVRPGENLYRIGLAYEVHWEQIARANGITHPSQLYAGQVLKIPVAKGGPEN